MKTLLSLFVAGVILLHAPAAFPHGEYRWITDNPETKFCCGEEDCRPLRSDEIRTENGAWFINGRIVGDVFPSQDAQPHGCFFDPETKLSPRCLFIPGMM